MIRGLAEAVLAMRFQEMFKRPGHCPAERESRIKAIRVNQLIGEGTFDLATAVLELTNIRIGEEENDDQT
jgi:hypothetical protein